MREASCTWKSHKGSAGLRAPRTVARNISLGVVAAALIATAAVPAFAGKPDREGHGASQKHEQTVSADARGKGKKKSKNITRRFTSSEAIEIPDSSIADGFGPADPYPSRNTVSGFKKARITDVNLTLRGFSHEFTRDVDVLLVAPDGRNAVVMGDVGGDNAFAGVTNLTITLDDEAAAKPPVADNVALTNGSFRPLDNLGLVDEPPTEGVLLDFPAPAPTPTGKNALATFDGIDPNGEWQLFILDDVIGDVGSLANGWSLEITAKSKGKGKKKH